MSRPNTSPNITQSYAGLSPGAAGAFAERWLPAWSQVDPTALLAFYSDDAFYSDPARPQGISGRADLRAYFEKLLRRHAGWVWTHTGSLPLPDGFLNFWTVKFAGGEIIEGVCTVQLRDGLICRNQVYFDRSGLPLRGRRDAVAGGVGRSS